ncbi:MAG TPA: PilZ domain-containing protein [Alkalispirochaeta sp.]|nr:PilZ domain-containing protein [Alkalispirochaeta sp.]
MLTDISSGFQSSTNETIGFIIVMAVIFVSLMGYQIYLNRTKGKPKKKKTTDHQPVLQRRPQTRRDLIDLSKTEQRVMDHLTWMLKDPKRQDRLIDDDRLLVRVARQAIREGIVTETEVLRLLRTLQVDHEALSSGGRTSETIPSGAEVSISDRNLNIAAGTLLLTADSGLKVRLDKGHRSIQPGTAVEVVCGGGDGLFRFHSAILQRSGKEVLLQHSRHVESVQRRKFRRRDLEVPVVITLPGIDERHLDSKSQDLSIGGAALKNPKKRIMTGSMVRLIIDAGSSSPVEISGTAVRSSRRGKTVHIRFENVSEDTRHRLFRKLLRLGGGHR